MIMKVPSVRHTIHLVIATQVDVQVHFLPIDNHVAIVD